MGAPARPHFAELAEDQAYKPLPKDFASEFESAARASADDHAPQYAAPGVTETGEEAERDLDVPAFMRRLQF